MVYLVYSVYLVRLLWRLERPDGQRDEIDQFEIVSGYHTRFAGTRRVVGAWNLGFRVQPSIFFSPSREELHILGLATGSETEVQVRFFGRLPALRGSC